MDIIITHWHDAHNDPGITDLPSPKDIVSRDIAQDDQMGRDPGQTDLKFGDQGQGEPGMIDTVCIPDCTGKECGLNGCDGQCGTCKTGLECIANKCICIPDCADKKCGSNGCGGQCGTCPAYSQCIDKKWKCASYGPCKSKYKIFCYTPNDPNGNYNEVSGNNGYGDNSDKIDLYDCGGGTIMAFGAEKIYEFDATQAGTVTLKFSSNADYLNAYVLKGSCNGGDCKAWTHSTTTLNVSKGDAWFIIVDATVNRTADYTMRLECSWTP